MKRFIVAVILLAFITGQVGCATYSDNIKPEQQSIYLYQDYNCEMLDVEITRVQNELDVLCASQDKSATADAVLMSVGLLIFWPALIAMAATDNEKAEISRMKGELEALREAQILKRCVLPVMELQASEVAK